MKFKINKDALSNCIQTAARAIGGASSMPILQNVLIKATRDVEITGTNLDFTISSTAKAEVETAGSTTVNARKLLEVASRLPAWPISIEADAKFGISVKSGKSSFRINGLDPADFPPIKGEAGKSFSIEQSKLKSLLKCCEFAACRDNSRHALLGFLIEATEAGLLVAAADGRRLAKISTEARLAAARFTIPLKPATEIASLCSGDKPIEISFTENKIIAKAEAFTVGAKLIDAAFPNIEQILPKSYANTVTVNRVALIEAAGRAAIVTSEKSSGIRLFFGAKTVNITAQSSEFGDAAEEVDCSLEGSPVEININPKYLIESLEASTCDNVFIKLNDSRSPLAVADAKNYICVTSPLMPK